MIEELNEEYIFRMENLLQLYAKEYDMDEPVVCFDEKPIQLLEDFTPYKSSSSSSKRIDCKYRRNGTANIFCAVEPILGNYYNYATKNRKGPEFAKVVNRIINKYPHASTIHFVMDNLSTHSQKSLERFYGEKHAKKLWDRLTVHYTPKGASWLNQAEIAIGLLSRQCLGKTRIPTTQELREKVNAWTTAINKKQISIKWGFSVDDARKKFKYE